MSWIRLEHDDVDDALAAHEQLEAALGKRQRLPDWLARAYLRREQDRALYAASVGRRHRLPSSGELSRVLRIGKSTAHRLVSEPDRVETWSDPSKLERWRALVRAGGAWRVPAWDDPDTLAGRRRDGGGTAAADPTPTTGEPRDGRGTVAGRSRDAGGYRRVGDTPHNTPHTRAGGTRRRDPAPPSPALVEVWHEVVDVLGDPKLGDRRELRVEDSPPRGCRLGEAVETHGAAAAVAVARWALWSHHRDAAYLRSRTDLLRELYQPADLAGRVRLAAGEGYVEPAQPTEQPVDLEQQRRVELLEAGLDPEQPVPTGVGFWLHTAHDGSVRLHEVDLEGGQLVVHDWLEVDGDEHDGGVWAYLARGCGSWAEQRLEGEPLARALLEQLDRPEHEREPTGLRVIDGGAG